MAPIVGALVGAVLAVMAVFTLLASQDLATRIISGVYLLLVAAAVVAYVVWERRRQDRDGLDRE